jgi:hypothetical protein
MVASRPRLCANALAEYNLVIARRGFVIERCIEGCAHTHSTLLPECLDDFNAEGSAVRVIEAFVTGKAIRNVYRQFIVLCRGGRRHHRGDPQRWSWGLDIGLMKLLLTG